MSGPEFDYERLAQEALRGIVRKVLERVAREGLPGEHHFYISFDTNADGVVMSDRLRGQYPEEMTIVMQHRFWDLIVSHDRFEVKLTFDAIPERLNVPYEAIKVFFDPSVPYGLQFGAGAVVAEPSALPRPPAALLEDDGPGIQQPAPQPAKKPTTTPALAAVASDDDTDDVEGGQKDGQKSSATVVELDAFRKK